MSRKRVMLMAGGTVASALTIGFFMQQGAPEPQFPASLVPAPIERAVLEPADTPQTDAVAGLPLELQEITLTSAQPAARAGEGELKLAGLGGGLALPFAPSDPPMPERGCAVEVTATPARSASVELSVSAPCFINERVTVHHSGMMFSTTTNDLGQLNVTVPALSRNAVFIVALANGKGGVGITQVPTLDDYDRVVLQWSGDNGFQVHAREFGASYGENGHVWSGSAETAGAAAGPDGRGFVTRLGDVGLMAPRMAEIYTFPTGMADRTGTVLLSVETEVTAFNCGKDIAAQSLELRGSKPLRTRDLVLSMPNCSAIGDFLVLNNLVDNLKIAAR